MKKWDFLVCVVVLGIGIALFFAMQSDNVGSDVEVYVNGELYSVYSLSENRTVCIETSFGKNTLCIRNGEVFVIESDCKDKLEIDAGKISRCGESLICLPNRLVLTIAGEGEVDSVSY